MRVHPAPWTSSPRTSTDEFPCRSASFNRDHLSSPLRSVQISDLVLSATGLLIFAFLTVMLLKVCSNHASLPSAMLTNPRPTAQKLSGVWVPLTTSTASTRYAMSYTITRFDTMPPLSTQYFLALLACLQLEGFILTAGLGMWIDVLLNTAIGQVTPLMRIYIGGFVGTMLVSPTLPVNFALNPDDNSDSSYLDYNGP